MTIHLPPEAAFVLAALQRAGYPAFAVGGCIRDSLLGRTPFDWDITTKARPEQVHQALSGCAVADTGLRHGTVTAVVNGRRLEITTFRTEGSYSDHRRPDSVAFADTVEEDLARRDFTVNAMAYSPETGLIDRFGGQADLKDRVLRSVGNPEKRFDEDALRILRGLRFASQLGFSAEPETERAMRTKRTLLQHLAPERVAAELLPLLCGPDAVPVLRRYRDVFAVVLPELAPMFDFDQQNIHHIYDVWEHTLHAVEAVPPEPLLRLCMLLHDCAKPERFSIDFRGDGHFYGHAGRGAEIAEGALRRLRLDEKSVCRITRLIRLHDHDILNTQQSLLRWLRLIGPEELKLLLQVKIADNLAQSPRYYRADLFRTIDGEIDRLLREGACYDRSRLAMDGRTLTELGFRGAEIGDMLEHLLDAVIAGRIANDRTALLQLAQQLNK